MQFLNRPRGIDFPLVILTSDEICHNVPGIFRS
jgi:hypothetical protein